MNTKTTTITAALIVAAALVAVQAVTDEAEALSKYHGKILVTEFERTAYENHDLLRLKMHISHLDLSREISDQTFMAFRPLMWLVNNDGNTFFASTYNGIRQSIPDITVHDLLAEDCPHTTQPDIRDGQGGITWWCFAVPNGFNPEVLVVQVSDGNSACFSGGICGRVDLHLYVPFIEPSEICELNAKVCDKDALVTVADTPSPPRPAPEPPAPATPQIANAVYNTREGELVIFWSEPVTLITARNLLHNGTDQIQMSLNDYNYTATGTVMWFKFSEETVNEIGEGNQLYLTVKENIVRGHDNTRPADQLFEALILN